jgi:hypothetical protein
VLAGHAHADLLSVHIVVDGTPMLIDAGTFTYRSPGRAWPVGEPAWRRYFAGPRAHNGLAIGDHDPVGALEGDFREPRPSAAVKLLRSLASGRLRWIEGEIQSAGPYGGYRRGVIHVVDRFWLVYDLQESSPADASFGFQTAPGTRVTFDDKIMLSSISGRAELALVHSKGLGRPTVQRGDSDPPAGWVSKRYGSKEEAAQLRLGWTGTHKLTAFVLTVAGRPCPARVEAIRAEGGGSAFRLQFGDAIDVLLASDPLQAGPWHALGMTSSGALSWWHRESDGAFELQNQAHGDGRPGEDIESPTDDQW